MKKKKWLEAIVEDLKNRCKGAPREHLMLEELSDIVENSYGDDSYDILALQESLCFRMHITDSSKPESNVDRRWNILQESYPDWAAKATGDLEIEPLVESMLNGTIISRWIHDQKKQLVKKL